MGLLHSQSCNSTPNFVSAQYLENKLTEILIPPNFMYVFILTRSSFGLLHVIFRTFVPEFWPSWEDPGIFVKGEGGGGGSHQSDKKYLSTFFFFI